MPYNELVEKVHSYLSLLKEEGETHIEVSQRRRKPHVAPPAPPTDRHPTETRPRASSATPTASRPKPEAPTGPPLAMRFAHRVEECGGAQDATRLVWIGEAQEFEQAEADLLQKMLYAMGYSLSEEKLEWKSDADSPSEASAILTLGQTTLDRATGKRQSLAMVRGKPVATPSGGRITPTFAPSYLNQNPAAKKAVWKDMLALLEREQLELPPWSKKFKKS